MPITQQDIDAFLGTVARAVGDGAVSLASIDIDNFRTYNEEHGHDGGDKLLVAWDRTLRGSLPKAAIVSRLGGDEYAVALPDFSAENALIVMEEIRTHFLPQASISVGVAARPPHAADLATLLNAAEDALARAKREGRARVAIWVEEKMTLKSNYYSRADLDRLAKLSDRSGRTEASLLREALDDLFVKYRDDL